MNPHDHRCERSHRRPPGRWATLDLPEHVLEVLSAAPLVQTPENRPQLLDWALGRSTGTTDWTLGNRDDHGVYEAVFHLQGNPNGTSRIVEAVITRARNDARAESRAGVALAISRPTRPC